MKIKKIKVYGLMAALIVALGVVLMSGCVQPKVVSPSGEPLNDAVVFILPQGGNLDLPPTVLFMAMEKSTVPRAYLDAGGSYKVVAWAPGCDGAIRIISGENLSKDFSAEIVLNELVGGPAAELSGILMLKEAFGEISAYPSNVIWGNGTAQMLKNIYLDELDSVYSKNTGVYETPLREVPVFMEVLNDSLFSKEWVFPTE